MKIIQVFQPAQGYGTHGLGDDGRLYEAKAVCDDDFDRVYYWKPWRWADSEAEAVKICGESEGWEGIPPEHEGKRETRHEHGSGVYNVVYLLNGKPYAIWTTRHAESVYDTRLWWEVLGQLPPDHALEPKADEVEP